MPEHCRRYSSRCANSGMPHDTFRHECALPSEAGLLAPLPSPYPTTSQFTFRGLSAGVLESYISTRCGTAAPSHGPVTLAFPVAHPKYLDIDSSAVLASTSDNTALPRTPGKKSTKERVKKDAAGCQILPGQHRPQAPGQNPAADFFKSMTIVKSPLRFEDSVSAATEGILGRSSSS